MKEIGDVVRMARMSAELRTDSRCYAHNMRIMDDLCLRFFEKTGYGGGMMEEELMKVASALNELEKMSVNFWYTQGAALSKESKERERDGMRESPPKPQVVNPKRKKNLVFAPGLIPKPASPRTLAESARWGLLYDTSEEEGSGDEWSTEVAVDACSPPGTKEAAVDEWSPEADAEAYRAGGERAHEGRERCCCG